MVSLFFLLLQTFLSIKKYLRFRLVYFYKKQTKWFVLKQTVLRLKPRERTAGVPAWDNRNTQKRRRHINSQCCRIQTGLSTKLLKTSVTAPNSTAQTQTNPSSQYFVYLSCIYNYPIPPTPPILFNCTPFHSLLINKKKCPPFQQVIILLQALQENLDKYGKSQLAHNVLAMLSQPRSQRTLCAG